jgi:predicted transcriptional regulator
MLVSQIMKKDCCDVKHTDLIEVAAKKMRETHAGTALVFEEGHISGIITEKEINSALAAVPSNSELKPAEDLMKVEQPSDDKNRCCYFSDVKIELLLGGVRV